MIADLPGLAALTISRARLTPAQFAVLESLPLGIAVKIEDQEHDDPIWSAFRRRRADRACRLSPNHRRAAAERYARGIALIGSRQDTTGRTVEIWHGDAGDEDIRLLRWLPQLENLQFRRCWGITTSALRHLAGHPNLRMLNLNGVQFTGPIRPLARCANLENLEFCSEDGNTPDDAHAAGLERLAGLRRLRGWTGAFTDATFARIGRLSQLQYLALAFGPLPGDDSLRPLAALRELELLDISTPTALSSECLRHLSKLTRLRALALTLEAGDGEGMRHLAGLKRLEFLTLCGKGVTDVGLQQLRGLTRLRVVQVPFSRVTAKGAVGLADALPAVTVHRMRTMAKSPQPVVRFRRRVFDRFASALIPAHWSEQSSPDDGTLEWIEDGFEGFDRDWAFYGAALQPATIQLGIQDCPRELTAAAYLREFARSSLGRVSNRFTAVVPETTIGLATATFPRDGSSYLAAASVRDGRAAAVHGEASPSRFARFRGLFAFVASSLRVGPAALAEEEVFVPAANLA
jgi:hypothetical protein